MDGREAAQPARCAIEILGDISAEGGTAALLNGRDRFEHACQMVIGIDTERSAAAHCLAVPALTRECWVEEAGLCRDATTTWELGRGLSLYENTVTQNIRN